MAEDDVTETTAAQAAKARAQSIADRLRVLLEEVDANEERDPGGVVQCMIYQSIAMLAYRVREFEIDLDFTKTFKMKGVNKNRYDEISVSLGEATIEKGGTLTNVKGKEAVVASRRGRR